MTNGESLTQPDYPTEGELAVIVELRRKLNELATEKEAAECAKAAAEKRQDNAVALAKLVCELSRVHQEQTFAEVERLRALSDKLRKERDRARRFIDAGALAQDKNSGAGVVGLATDAASVSQLAREMEAAIADEP